TAPRGLPAVQPTLADRADGSRPAHVGCFTGALRSRTGDEMSSKRFAGKTVAVTGAGSGLGRATALRLGAEEAAVGCLDLVLDAAERSAAEIVEHGGRARAYQVDVADPASARAAIGRLAKELGRPAVLVNSAGIGKFANAHEMPFEEWSRIIAVNLTGTFL